MSSLWKKIINISQLIMQKRPSPTKNKHISCFAQGIYNPFFRKLYLFIKRISLFTSLSAKADGSMTVEASIVLPLFLFFFLNLGSVIEVIRLHGNLELALWETGNRLAVYGHVLDGGNKITGVALSYTYVKSQMIEYLGEDYLENSPLSYGTDGLQFLESNIWKDDDTFEVILTYSVSPLSRMAGFRSFRMANCYYGHLWTGYEIPGTEGDVAEQYVYIAETGQVYHTNAGCTYLVLSVRQVSYQEALGSRNNQGEKYDACEKCSKWGCRGSVYITNEGDCYHFERECPGLKRTVRHVPLSEVLGYRLCSRCGA